MKERPILFSSSMVRAILAGKKTQTRRLWKPRWHSDARLLRMDTVESMPVREAAEYLQRVSVCPYGVPGSELWVRESFYLHQRSGRGIPDHDVGAWCHVEGGSPLPGWKKHPGIHMPRWASRLTLRITDVRVQRLQEISAKDILAEGVVERPHRVDGLGKCPLSAFDGKVYVDLRSLWQAGWDSINAKRAPWSSNPWVWVVEFEKVGAK